ncbi:MAG: OFA family MFS transporter [Treponema sp.]|nr:OFA family MFS transporter [Treponema sp.]
MNTQSTQNKAPIILVACIMVNLAIGVLYAWSVMKARLTMPVIDGGFGWTVSQAGFPYSLAIIVFAVALLIGGRIQDKIGPRLVVTAGGAFVGIGLALSGLVGNSVIGITLCFGVIAATGMGFCYGCVSPPALKWYHPSKKGLVSGLIVGGFGLSAVYYAPLTTNLLNNFGISRALLMIGIGTFIISVSIAQLIKNPPAGYVPAAPAESPKSGQADSKAPPKTGAPADATWREALGTKRFRMMFLMFLLASSVGLMIVGNMTKIAEAQLGIRDAALLALIVSFLGVTNTLGRVMGGVLSDKIGRINSLFVVISLQMVNMFAFAFYQNLFALSIGIILVGFCYGTLLSVMPALCADLYGLKNFGMNYGILFLAWGFAGIIAPLIADSLYDATGSFNTAYIICAIMMGAMVFVNYLLKRDIEKGSKAAI